MDIQLTQILFQIVNFSVVVGALTFFLYKPVIKIFDERANRIAEGQKAAQKAIETKEELDSLQQKAQSEMKKERAEILVKAQEEAKVKAQEIIAQAKKEAQAEHAKLIASWEKEKQTLLANAKKDMIDAVVAVSAKVIGTTLADGKNQQKLIDTQLDSVLKNI